MKENNTQKRILVILLTVLVFLSGTILGFATVFRVDDITVKVSAISAASVEEAQELRTRLQEKYINENIFLSNDENAQIIIKDFPYESIKSGVRDIKAEDAAKLFQKKIDELGYEYKVKLVDGMLPRVNVTPEGIVRVNPKAMFSMTDIEGLYQRFAERCR